MKVLSYILVIIAVLGLSACASSRKENVYNPGKTVKTTQPISLPTDLNRADIEDYYEVPTAGVSGKR